MGLDDIEAVLAVLAAAQEIVFLEFVLVKIVDVVHEAASFLKAARFPYRSQTADPDRKAITISGPAQ
jgi:hypothetical protein